MRIDAAPEGFRQAMAWLHTWAGLLLGWLMFAIFLSGTLAFFRLELNHWSRPELHQLGPSRPGLSPELLARAERLMATQLAPQAPSWRLSPADARRPLPVLSWREPPAAPGQRARVEQRWLPAAADLPAARATFGLGEFFYRFHFELRSAAQSRWTQEGRWVVGLATLLMLVALISGVATHRRIFADFFTFRPRAKAAQRAWLDAHNLCGVLALPFTLVITFSGLMALHTLYLPAGLALAYGQQKSTYFNELAGDRTALARGARGNEAGAGPLPLLGEAGWTVLLAQVQARLEADANTAQRRIDGVSVLREQGRAVVEFNRHDGDRLQYRGPRLLYDAQTLSPLREGDTGAPAARTYGVLYGLHVARFADPALRVLLFGLGLMGSAMVATGLLLWSVKRCAEAQRRRQGLGRGHRLVDLLNLGVIAGLPLAMAAFGHASRWLPLALQGRQDLEMAGFFATWALALLAAALGCRWRALFGAGALAWVALPVLDALAFVPPWQASTGPVLGVNAGFLLAAGLLALLAWCCGRRGPRGVAHGLAAGAVMVGSTEAAR